MKRVYIFALALVVFASLSVSATIFNIPDDYPTIQQGIDASTDADTVLVQPGNYVENINFNGHNIVLGSLFLTTGDTTVIATTIIDGDSSGSVVTFANHEHNTAQLTGFTIKRGSSNSGGGISCYMADPTIRNNIITDNCSGRGGGIYSIYSSPVISSNIIVNNIAEQGSGGGISLAYDNGQRHPLITNNVIANNSAYYKGGGIICGESWSEDSYSHQVVGNVISGNTAISGGGMFFEPGLSATYAVIAGNKLYDNFAEISGGGLGINGSHAEIRGNIFKGNSCADQGFGGGIQGSYFSSNTIFRHNTLISNSAYFGAGIYFHGGQLKIRSSTVVQNTGVYGAGIYAFADTLDLSNSIIWSNVVQNGPVLYSDDLGADYCDIQDTIWPGEGNVSIDPLFRDPDNSDFHLMSTVCGDLYDSPCIDAGHPDILDSLLDCSWGLGELRSDMGAYGGGDSVIVGIGYDEIPVPDQFFVAQNYPNPFNASTVIEYNLLSASDVIVEIYDLLGRRVETLLQREQPAGYHRVVWDASDHSSNLYFYRIQAGDYAETKKMVLLK